MLPPVRLATCTCALALLSACGGSGNDIGAGIAGYAYVVTTMPQARGAVTPYTISADGSLSPLSSGAVPTGMNPTSIVSDPTGHYVYVVNLGDATISQFSVGSGGALASLSPAVVSVPTPSTYVWSYAASIDSSGHFLYLVGQAFPGVPPTAPGVILQFSIGSGGALTSLSPSFVNVSAQITGPLAIDPAGQYAYLAAASEVLQFSISGNGTLVPLAQPSIATTNAVNVTVAPGGRSAYVLGSCVDAACDGEISEYAVGTDGTLTPTGSTTATDSHVIPIALETDTSGSSAYLLANQMGVDTNVGSVYQFGVSSTGALQPDSPPSVSVASGAVAQGVFRSSLYVLSGNAVGSASGSPQGGHVDHYAIGSGGVLAEKGTISLTSGYPSAMAVVAVQ
jgi:6-phosphogluconolactonase (cycloisomerase 2 family)